MIRTLVGLAAAAAALSPALRRSRARGDALDDVVAAMGPGPLDWERVEQARRLVAACFQTYSCRHPWVSPAQAAAEGRGFSPQYNGALQEVLERLGARVRPVFAARVRMGDTPWWHAGHMWLEVGVDGQTRSLCAQYATGPGELTFVPLTEVRPFGRVSRWDVRAVMTVISAAQQWRARLTGDPPPRWFEHPFGEAA